MSILIKNGQIITATDNYIADIYVEHETITTIGKNLNRKADEIIDASGKLIFPGGIDPHTHMDMPFKDFFSSDNFETGTLAGLHGGTTAIIDYATQSKGGTLKDAIAEWHGKASGNAYGDYGFHVIITDFTDSVKNEIQNITEKEGISSFKIFMAYKGALMLDDRQITAIMQEAEKYGAIVAVHATNGDIIDYLTHKHKSEGKLSPLYHYLSQPGITEIEASGRFIDLADFTKVKSYIVHIASGGALDKVRQATLRNQKVFAETCPQYLILDASVYNKGFESAKWVISPPVREKSDQESLWAGINQGLIQVVATDHCPFMWNEKMKGKHDFTKIPNGAPGIEHRIELLYSEGVKQGKISLNKLVEVCSTNAAKIFGMFPQKGTIAIGTDADIVIFDPDEKHTISAKTHHHRCDFSAYEGLEITGKCKIVILRGKTAMKNGKILINKGYGKFIKRKITQANI